MHRLKGYAIGGFYVALGIVASALVVGVGRFAIAKVKGA